MEKFIAALLFLFVVALLMMFPTMWLVNYVFSDVALVAVFGGPLTCWKALCLNFLCSWLFKNASSSSCKCK